MGAPPICTFEHGCPVHPTWVSLSPHEDGCPVGAYEDGCPVGATKMGVPSVPTLAPTRTWGLIGIRMWVSLSAHAPSASMQLGEHEDGCPFDASTNMGVLIGTQHGCPFGQQIWVSPRRRRWVSFPHRPLRTDRGVSQRSTNMGVPWHPSLEHGCPLAPIASGCSSQRAGVHDGVACCRGPWRAGTRMAREGDGHYSGGP